MDATSNSEISALDKLGLDGSTIQATAVDKSKKVEVECY
jgi:hypothetical protein